MVLNWATSTRQNLAKAIYTEPWCNTPLVYAKYADDDDVQDVVNYDVVGDDDDEAIMITLFINENSVYR